MPACISVCVRTVTLHEKVNNIHQKRLFLALEIKQSTGPRLLVKTHSY